MDMTITIKGRELSREELIEYRDVLWNRIVRRAAHGWSPEDPKNLSWHIQKMIDRIDEVLIRLERDAKKETRKNSGASR